MSHVFLFWLFQNICFIYCYTTLPCKHYYCSGSQLFQYTYMHTGAYHEISLGGGGIGKTIINREKEIAPSRKREVYKILKKTKIFAIFFLFFSIFFPFISPSFENLEGGICLSMRGRYYYSLPPESASACIYAKCYETIKMLVDNMTDHFLPVHF